MDSNLVAKLGVDTACGYWEVVGKCGHGGVEVYERSRGVDQGLNVSPPKR